MRISDELYSIQKFLSDLYNLENHSARRRDAITRPYFRIELAARATARLGAIGWQDLSEWIIWYHSTNETDARTKADKINSRLKSTKYIQGYLEDFQFPDPLLTAVTVTGGSLSGVQQFAISGVRNGSETLVSTINSITVPSTNNGVKLQLPKVPSWYSEFDIIKIYADVSGSLNLQMGVSIVDRSLHATHIVPSIFASSEIPETTSAVLYKTIFVDEIGLDILEDPLEDGLWDARIGLTTKSTGLIDTPQVYDINQIGLKDGSGIDTTMLVVLP